MHVHPLPNELFFAPAAELAARVRARELSPVDLMHATLERIDALNPRVNAIVSIRPAEQLRPWRDQWPRP